MRNLIAALCLIGGLLPLTSKASHVVGGDIYVQWVSANTYDITVRVYRDCDGITLPTTVSLGVYDLATDATNQTMTINLIQQQFLDLGDSCYTPTNLCIEEGIYQITGVTIPDNPNGYYLQTQIYARNAVIDNITNPGSTGMSFYAEMPDPALGQNSSPDFGAYPSDGYLCTSYRKELEFNVTDPDGDSLSYSLIDPLQSVGTGNLTNSGPYTPVNWLAPYSLADICGGTPPMDIDPVTGIVSAQPAILGVYVFSVQVEEWRDTTIAQNGPKVKIGETRRDMQYAALNCSQDLPPEFLPFQDTTVQVVVGNQNCFDIIAEDLDAQDTIYLELSSTTFTQGAFYGESPAVGINQHNYGYWDAIAGMTDSLLLPDMEETSPGSGLWFETGIAATRYCWTPECVHLDTAIYEINALSYSLGCSGSDTTTATFFIEVLPPPDAAPVFTMQTDTNRYVPVLTPLCFDIIVQDPDVQDTVFLEISTPMFGLENAATYESTTSDYIFFNDATGMLDTVYLQAGQTWPVSEALYGTGGVGAHFCWDALCRDLDPVYPVNLAAYSIGYCGDTVFASMDLLVDTEPVIPEFRNLPNVFTPNGDGINDVFTIDGDWEPCFDDVRVEIYNRWGQLVFEGEIRLDLNQDNFEWDGTDLQGNDCSEGTYYMIISGMYASQNVETLSESVNEQKHTINLFRGGQ